MNKHHKTALNMAKFIQGQSLLLLEKLNELELDTEADICERLHEDAERLHAGLLAKLNQE
jgi:precorrin-6B methylase 1